MTLEGAKRVIAAGEAQAKQLNAPGAVIAVVDDGGNLMALERLDGTFSAGANVSLSGYRPRMANSTSRSRSPSYVPDVAKVQIWCAFAETLLGEATFSSPVM